MDWLKQLVDIMREIQASEAKIHLPQLLDEIERGETIVITRHGRPIARLIPEDAMRRHDRGEAVERLKALRATMPQVRLEELLVMRHEGHKY
jgi:prevent-host-death family protein